MSFCTNSDIPCDDCSHKGVDHLLCDGCFTARVIEAEEAMKEEEKEPYLPKGENPVQDARDFLAFKGSSKTCDANYSAEIVRNLLKLTEAKEQEAWDLGMAQALSKGMQPQNQEPVGTQEPGERPTIYISNVWEDKKGEMHQAPRPAMFVRWSDIDRMWAYMDELERKLGAK